MNLKMYRFDDGGLYTWICATTEQEAISLYKKDISEDMDGTEMEEMKPEEEMSYYDDGVNEERETYQTLIQKYCDKPMIFATSEF